MAHNPSAVSYEAADLQTGALAEARRWLARELHDGPVQTLTTVIVQLDEMRMNGSSAGQSQQQLDEISEATREVMRDLRRVVGAMRAEPSRLGNLACWIDTALRAVRARTGMATSMTKPPGALRVTPVAAVEVRRIIGEALTNVCRHSSASRVDVTLQHIDDAVAVTVTDDGRGFDTSLIAPGFGMRGMRERAQLIGARLAVDSSPEDGTVVRLVIPAGARR